METAPTPRTDRIELFTGERSAWRDVGPPGTVDTLEIPRVFLSADGQSHVYTYVRLLDELFLVDGLK